MRRVILLTSFVVLGILVVLNPVTQATEAVVGKPASNFTATDSNGKSHSLSDYKGKVVVLEWLNHGCPYVKKHYNSGNMQKLQKTYTEKGIIWFSIISSAPGKQGYSTPEEANEVIKQKQASPTALLLDPDGIVGKLYGAKTTPHMYIIDSDGVLVYNGGIDDIRSSSVDDIAKAKNYVTLALDELLAGKEVSIKTSRPYGCSVKYK
ncbi:MAG: thioredoxin family protein [Candidatus Aminicenantes bacterium]|nr:MAG: thioredoxin family protein [Candidatus Aminicenantes bacterium]